MVLIGVSNWSALAGAYIAGIASAWALERGLGDYLQWQRYRKQQAAIATATTLLERAESDIAHMDTVGTRVAAMGTRVAAMLEELRATSTQPPPSAKRVGWTVTSPMRRDDDPK